MESKSILGYPATCPPQLTWWSEPFYLPFTHCQGGYAGVSGVCLKNSAGGSACKKITELKHRKSQCFKARKWCQPPGDPLKEWSSTKWLKQLLHGISSLFPWRVNLVWELISMNSAGNANSSVANTDVFCFFFFSFGLQHWSNCLMKGSLCLDIIICPCSWGQQQRNSRSWSHRWLGLGTLPNSGKLGHAQGKWGVACKG